MQNLLLALSTNPSRAVRIAAVVCVKENAKSGYQGFPERHRMNLL
jgi:hypothetical protein